MDEGLAHLIDGTIASYGHDHVIAVVTCLCRQCGGMAGSLRIHYIIIPSVMVDVLANQLRDAGFFYRAGDGVHDEGNSHSVLFSIGLQN